jgi:hypothetical protein
LDDLRRLRKCAGYLHVEPFYFLGRNVRREESGHHFCDDPCRTDLQLQEIHRKTGELGAREFIDIRISEDLTLRIQGRDEQFNKSLLHRFVWVSQMKLSQIVFSCRA